MHLKNLLKKILLDDSSLLHTGGHSDGLTFLRAKRSNRCIDTNSDASALKAKVRIHLHV